jgi:hypothetical protein
MVAGEGGTEAITNLRPALPCCHDCEGGVVGAAALHEGADALTIPSKAALRIGGNVRLHLSARRNIPAQALGLKQRRDRWPPISKISDNEDSTTGLGDSEMPSVKHSPGAMIPAFRHGFEESSEIPPAPGREHPRNVFKDDPLRPESSNNREADEGQVATRVIQSETLPGD